MAKPTYYSKRMLWVKPFVDSVSDLVPVDRIMRIRDYRVKKGLDSLSYGSRLTYGNRYSINIELDVWKKSHKSYVGETYQIILDTVAHELAHTIHSEHTPKHYQLQARILLRFSRILKDNGILDHSIRWRRKK